MAQSPRKKLARTSYHVAWICPVADLELLPAILMMDEEHERPDIDNHADENIYEFGSAAGHNIVLATCRQGMTGNVNVSSITAPLFKTFPNIRMTLLVGIGGGVPQPDSFSDPLNDLRLGDVVVGWPTSADGRGAVVYFEYGRSRVDGFEITGTMDKPHTVILNALPSLKLDHDLGRSTFDQYMAKLQKHERLGKRFKHPGLQHDKLFQPSSIHLGGYTSNCKDCDSHQLVRREPRTENQKELFIYHQGRIGTGNSVIMDGEKRDSISAQCGGALCIEMEAAGVEVNSRCLVIRGISDYADSHKSDLWRSYAAGKAVVFARELLGKIPARDVKEKMALGNKHWLVDRSASPHFTGRREVMDRIVRTIISGDSVHHQRRVVLTGMGGQGKSEICLQVANEVRDIFWGVFWVDVSTRNLAEENFSEVAEALGCQKTVDSVRKKLASLPVTCQWLLILDNADDPQRDYQAYFPPGNRGAILMTSRNPQCGRLTKMDDHEELDSLDESECIKLLQKTARLPRLAPETDDYISAVSLVKDLGFHTLAVLHAASYIATTHCRIADYQEFLKTNRRRLLEKSGGQGQPRYDTVYATFGASIEFLELSETGVSEETRQDSLQLLKLLSTFHYKSMPLDVLVDAWEGVKEALTPSKDEMDSGVLTAWHVAQVPDFIRTEKDNLKFRVTEAVTRLESLALVRTDQSGCAWKSVSMHPLVHGWAGDHQSQHERKEALRMAECVIALSYFAPDSWRPYYRQFAPHLKLVVESDTQLVQDAARSRCILQACVHIAWIYHWVWLDRNMYELTGSIFRELGLYNQQVTDELREFYRVLAIAIDRERSCPPQALEIFEAIALLDQQYRDDNDPARLDNLRDLGRAYLDTSETEQAIALLRRVMEGRRNTEQVNGDQLTAEYDLAWALARNGEKKEALTLLEKVVEAQKRLLPAGDPDRFTAQGALAMVYLRTGQIRDATPLLEEVARFQSQVYGNEHTETATTRFWLADAYDRAGRSSEAIALYERVVDIRTVLLGENHLAVLRSLIHLATAYLKAGLVAKAVDLVERLGNIENPMLDDISRSRLLSLHEVVQKDQEAVWAFGRHGLLHDIILGIRQSLALLEDEYPDPNEPFLLGTRNNEAMAEFARLLGDISETTVTFDRYIYASG